MTESEMKTWIAWASYRQLLAKWRFEPLGSPWFVGDVGAYFCSVMQRMKETTPHGEQVAASKAIGWQNGT